MDLESIKQLVEQIAAVMSPALPGLLSKGGEEMAKSVAGALGKDLWDEAKHLWNLILPVAQQSPGLSRVRRQYQGSAWIVRALLKYLRLLRQGVQAVGVQHDWKHYFP